MKNKWVLLFYAIFLVSIAAFSQEVKKQMPSREVYIKVKRNAFKSTNNINSDVSISSELPFLRTLSNSAVQDAKRPFYAVKENGVNRVYKVKFSEDSDIKSVVEKLKSDPAVELVEYVYPRTIISTPNDSLYSSQWYLSKIKAPEAWDISVPTGEVVVAIVDNAFQVNHPDLAANMLPGYDVADGDNDPSPPNATFSHGTHVAGIVSAVNNNTIGISAAANNRIKILPIKATPDYEDYRSIVNGYEGIAWAIVNKVDIISLSWGGSGYSQIEQDIINYAYDNNILVIAAAGNSGLSDISYPAGYDHVLSVASVDSLDIKSYFSTYGSTVDISAPGSSILSTIPFGNYQVLSGTSMATPLVASICGYILSAYPSMLPDEIENLVKNTAKDISSLNTGFSGKLGAGRVNMLNAVACRSLSLHNLKLTSASDPQICSGDTISLNASIPDLDYTWYKDGLEISGEDHQQINVNTEGSYTVKISSGSCELLSTPLRVSINSIKTPVPTVNYVENFYCEDSVNVQKLVSQTSLCVLSGPKTFTYTGPTIGYDGGLSTGGNLTAFAHGLTGNISTLEVEIIWDKKDGYSLNNCDDPSGPGAAYYAEVSFALKSPSGVFQIMIPEDQFSNSTTSQGDLTTKFVIGGSALGSIPSSGTFQPYGDFTKFIGEDPNGIWTLIADDYSSWDPLCVKGFSVTIKTDAVDSPPEVSWWSATSGGTLLSTGNEYIPSTTSIGEQAVYLSAKCVGGCESERIKAIHYVKPRPYIIAYPIDTTFVDEFVAEIFVENLYSGTVLNGFILKNAIDSTELKTYSTIIAKESPVSVCEKTCFVVRAEDCPSNNVNWSFGLQGESRIVCTTGDLQITANCISSLDCPPVSSNTMEFKDGLQSLVLDRRLAENTEEIFYGNTITSIQYISTLSQVKYSAVKSIELLPGFEFSGNKKFQASIGGCP